MMKTNWMETLHDFWTIQPWVYASCCYLELRSPLYIGYMVLFTLLLTYLEGASFWAGYLSLMSGDMSQVFRAVHTFLVGIFGTVTLLHRLSVGKTLKGMRATLMTGIYRYPEEEMDAEGFRILQGIREEVEWKSKAWYSVMLVGYILNVVGFPISRWFTVAEDEYDATPDFTTPYLPNFFWSPYNRTIWGYLLMYLLNAFLLFSTYGIASCQNMIYLSWNVQLRTHLQLLNHSIRNVEGRALKKYENLRGVKASAIPVEDLYGSQMFQDCVYQCLCSNIRHHQALLRLKVESKPFVSQLLTTIVIMVALFYGTLFLLILQGPPMGLLLSYIATFVVENCYTFFQCFFGQDIQDHSASLFESLYSAPWYKCNNRCNQLISIMMSNTLIPMKLKAFYIDIPANVETYAETLKLTYSVINLFR